MQNPRCHGAARPPFSHSYLLSLLSPRPPVRPVPLFAKTNDDDGAHLLPLPPSLPPSVAVKVAVAFWHRRIYPFLPSFFPSVPLLFDHSQYRRRRRRLRRCSSVTPPPSAPHPLGLTHFHRNAVFASSTTTTRCGARQWHAPIDCGQILRLFRTHFVTASHSQSPMRLFVNSSEAATLCAFATMLGAKAIFLYSPFPLPLSTWMIGDSAAANSDDGFIAVIICKAAEYRTSGDVHEKEEGKDDPQMHQQHLGGTMRRGF